MAAQKKTEVAVKEEQSTALAAYDYDEMAGAGMEDLDASDLQIPLYRVLQSNSPQVDTDSDTYIEGAKVGDIFNTVTEEVISGDSGMQVIPVVKKHQFPAFVPRDEGGGFQGVYDASDPRIAKWRAAQGSVGKLQDDEGNEVVETFYVFVLRVLADGSTEKGVLPFASTQIKKYRQWMTKLQNLRFKSQKTGRMLPYPMFAHLWNVTTVKEENKKGKFRGYKISLAGNEPQEARLGTDDERFQEAAEFHKMVQEDKVQAAHDTDEKVKGSGDEDDSIPF